jgi:hypothetical protein
MNGACGPERAVRPVAHSKGNQLLTAQHTVQHEMSCCTFLLRVWLQQKDGLTRE